MHELSSKKNFDPGSFFDQVPLVAPDESILSGDESGNVEGMSGRCGFRGYAHFLTTLMEAPFTIVCSRIGLYGLDVHVLDTGSESVRAGSESLSHCSFELVGEMVWGA